MRVVFYWEAAGLSLTRANPYGGLLARALAPLGVEMIPGYAEDLTPDWLRAHQGQVDVLHLNWPNGLYQSDDPPEAVRRASDLVANLALARQLGYRVVWTVHNLYPHESAHPELDRLVQTSLCALATAVIAHCQHGRRLVREHFHREGGVLVIPHGHFIEPYPATLSRAEARGRLGIGPNQFVLLFFGNVRRYKGIEGVLDAFRRLPGDDLTLLLAAKVYSEYGDGLVDEARQADPRVVVSPSRFFANEEFQVYFRAANVAVLPFLNVLTSGSTITALGFGVPVVVPAIGCLPELVDETVGILYDPTAPDALFEAMRAIRGRDTAALGRAALARAQSLGWDGIARQTLAAYQLGG